MHLNVSNEVSMGGGIFILMRNMKLTETQEQPFAMSNLNVPMQT